jgi:8-oxo-dGTP diphosphatase
VERKPAVDHTTHLHETVAVVLQVREQQLQVLLWQRALAPQAGRWALPGGRLDHAETL